MKFQAMLESYGMLNIQQRTFYPKNLKLSPEFIAVLKKEINVQNKAGIKPDEFAKKLNRALHFFISEYKKINKAKPVDTGAD